ncbi:disease resistance protein RPV1-like [Ziziphus jujuba]|uniref:Disease resistance protein RPV1-like n=1 Tax=Ziziphus jujuba TaxID=326968 RepID=A0ABM4AAS2_ZIZJJ|nr:disease resistance protein RPV1-like [Ziziphus jujuba]
MSNLRLRRMHGDDRFDNRGKLYQRSCCWDFKKKECPENLVELVMRKSQLVKLYWNEDQPIEKLKKIDLIHSQDLIQIPNLCGAENLQSINLRGCKSLSWIQVPSYFKDLNKLQHLDLGNCKNLRDGIENIPLTIKELRLYGTAIEVLPSSFGCLLDLEGLDLSHCKNLKDGIENLPSNIRELGLYGTAIEVLPSSFRCLLDLKVLDLSACKNLKDGIENLPLNIKELRVSGIAIEVLPSTFGHLLDLKVLDLTQCKNLKDGIENLPLNIRELRLSGTAIEVLPSTFGRLLDLANLHLSQCKNLKNEIVNLPLNISELRLCGTAVEVLPSSFGRLLDLTNLDLRDCRNLEDVQNISMCIIQLHLSGTAIKTLPASIWMMSRLKRLFLWDCLNLEKIPEIQYDCLSPLETLKINGCLRLKSIPELPSCLKTLDARNCTSLETISSWRDPIEPDLGEERCIYNYDPQYQLIGSISVSYYFENCLKLDQHTLKNIIAESLHRRIFYVQDITYLEALYPGNEIPEWFSHQTDDGNSSIHIQLPPNWFHIRDPRFRFVCCVFFLLNGSGPYINISFQFNFKTKMNSGHTLSVYNSLKMPLVDTIYPDHVFMKYQTIDLEGAFGTKWSSVCSNVTEASCRVFIQGKGVINREIKKCGLELFNKWDASKN